MDRMQPPPPLMHTQTVEATGENNFLSNPLFSNHFSVINIVCSQLYFKKDIKIQYKFTFLCGQKLIWLGMKKNICETG